jgi:O-antigen/teichoic acid export membrane protein
MPRQLTTGTNPRARIAEAAVGRTLTGLVAGLGIAAFGSLLVGPGPEPWIAAAIPILATPTIIATAWSLANGRTFGLLPSSIVGFATTLVIATIAIRSQGSIGAFEGMTAGVAIEGVLAWRLTHVLADWTPGIGLTSRATNHLRGAAPFAVQAMVGIVYARVPVLVLAVLGPTVVATFSTAFNLYAAAALVPAALSLATYPRLTRATAGRDRRAFLLASEPYFVAAAAFTAAAILASAASEPLITAVYGSAFEATVPVFRILMIGLALTAANAYLSVSLFALQADRYAVGISLMALIILVAAVTLALPLAATGAAATLVGTESVATIAAILVFQRRIKHLA